MYIYIYIYTYLNLFRHIYIHIYIYQQRIYTHIHVRLSDAIIIHLYMSTYMYVYINVFVDTLSQKVRLSLKGDCWSCWSVNYELWRAGGKLSCGCWKRIPSWACVTLSALAAIELLVPAVEVSLYIYTINTCIYIYV